MPSAQKVTWAKFRVTVVSIVAIVILAVLFYLLTGGTLLQPKVTLRMYIPDATGLSLRAPVSVNGVDVGRVSRVDLSGSKDPNRVVRVSMEVEESHLRDIPADSTAELGTETMIGDKFVDVTSGRDPARIRPGGEIRFKPSQDLTKSLDMTQFIEQLRQVDAEIRDVQEGRNQLGQFLKGDDLYNQVLAGIARIESAFQGAVKTTGQVGSMLYTDELYRRIQRPLVDLDQTLANLQAGQGDAGRLLRDPAQYAEWLNNLGSLRQSIARIQSSAFVQSDDLYTNLNRSLISVMARVDAAQQSPLFATSEMYDNLSGMAREMTTTLRDFRQNPKKFLRMKIF